jgi:hypothetical protein
VSKLTVSEPPRRRPLPSHLQEKIVKIVSKIVRIVFSRFGFSAGSSNVFLPSISPWSPARTHY